MNSIVSVVAEIMVVVDCMMERLKLKTMELRCFRFRKILLLFLAMDETDDLHPRDNEQHSYVLVTGVNR